MSDSSKPLPDPASPLPFAPSITTRELVFVSGQVPNEPTGSIQEQTNEALEKIGGILAGHGIPKSNIVKVTVFLAEREDFRGMNDAFAAFFGDHRPTRSTIVTQLVVDAKVEIEAIASR